MGIKGQTSWRPFTGAGWPTFKWWWYFFGNPPKICRKLSGFGNIYWESKGCPPNVTPPQGTKALLGELLGDYYMGDSHVSFPAENRSFLTKSKPKTKTIPLWVNRFVTNFIEYYSPEKQHVLQKAMVGRCIPYWNSPFLGDMYGHSLVFGVCTKNINQNSSHCGEEGFTDGF